MSLHLRLALLATVLLLVIPSGAFAIGPDDLALGMESGDQQASQGLFGDITQALLNSEHWLPALQQVGAVALAFLSMYFLWKLGQVNLDGDDRLEVAIREAREVRRESQQLSQEILEGASPLDFSTGQSYGLGKKSAATES